MLYAEAFYMTLLIFKGVHPSSASIGFPLTPPTTHGYIKELLHLVGVVVVVVVVVVGAMPL